VAYLPLDRFLVRAPLLRWAGGGDPARRLLGDPLGRVALTLASPSLAAHPQGERARRALARYGRRATFRPTPSGLLAGVTIGALAARSGGASGEPRAHWGLAWSRVAALGRALLEDPAIQTQVQLRHAPSLLRGPDRARWLAFGESEADEREADLDARLARILDAAACWSRWDAVRAAVNADDRGAADSGDEDADELLLLLIDDGVLHHDLIPPLVGAAPAQWMIERLGDLRPAVPEAATLASALSALTTGDFVGAHAILDQLPDLRDATSDEASPPLVATLIHQPTRPLTLDRRVVERAARLAPLLFRLQEALTPPIAERFLDPALDEAVATASELFGDGALDLAALALGAYGVDPALSADHADADADARHAAGPRRDRSAPPAPLVRLLIDEIGAARAAGRAEIALDPATLDAVLPALPPPPTCELFLTPVAARTGWLLGLHAPAGATWGRFAHALGAPLAEALAALSAAEISAQPDPAQVDVAYAPTEGLADLCAHPRLRAEILSLSTWPAASRAPAHTNGEPDSITPADLALVIGPGLEHPALALAATRRELSPSPLARVRSSTAPPGIFRFLAGFSLVRQHAPWALTLGPLAALAYLPRISVDGFVVSPASWRLPDQVDARALGRWRRGQAGAPPPPRWVQVGAEDELLPVDLAAPDALDDLAGQPRAWEIWPPPDTPGIDRDGRRIEAVIALVDRNLPARDDDNDDDIAPTPARARAQVMAAAGRVPPPRAAPAAPGWLTFKLFGVEDRQNQILCDAIAPTVAAARAAGEIDGWFFLRYADDRGRRPHLRLRVHAENCEQPREHARARLDGFAARLDGALAGAFACGAVALLETGAYHPEVARFGGDAAMAAVHQIFESDSALACALLANLAEPAGNSDEDGPDLVGRLVAVFDQDAAGLGLALPERHALARRRRHAEAALTSPPDDADRRALDGDFRGRAAALRARLGAPPPADPLTRLLADHRQRVSAATAALDAAARSRLAAPLLHLSAVRLAGADRAIEGRAYFFWERTLEGLLRSPPPMTSAPSNNPQARNPKAR
jgi:lantibiotic biosynthesis protein